MKFNLIDEDFTSERNKRTHYQKHVIRNKEFDVDPDTYEKNADILSRLPVDNKLIFGYISETRENKHAYCKYNKSTEEFVCYTYHESEPVTITYFTKPWRQYIGDKAIEYYDEIPTGM